MDNNINEDEKYHVTVAFRNVWNNTSILNEFAGYPAVKNFDYDQYKESLTLHFDVYSKADLEKVRKMAMDRTRTFNYFKELNFKDTANKHEVHEMFESLKNDDEDK